MLDCYAWNLAGLKFGGVVAYSIAGGAGAQALYRTNRRDPDILFVDLPLLSRRYTVTELTVTLPDDLARKAREAGLLSPAGIERALREALRREAGRKLREIRKALQESGIPLMSEDEIQAEIDAYRAERRARRGAPRA